MKIAVTARGRYLDSLIDRSFGHCKHIIIFNTSSKSIDDVLDNPARDDQTEAQTQSGLMLIDHDADVLLTESIGPRAGDILAAGGIAVFRVRAGTVKNAIKRFLSNELPLRRGPIEGMYPDPGSPASDSIMVPEEGRGIGIGQSYAREIHPTHDCVCPFCGINIPHDPARACEEIQCPVCNNIMVPRFRKSHYPG